MARQPKPDNADAAQRVAAVLAIAKDDDAFPTDADGTPIPLANGQDADPTVELVISNGRSERDQKYADLIQIVHGAETLRFDAQTTVDLETELDAAADLLAHARAQEANREHVDPAILRELKEHSNRWALHLDSWLLQRGLRKAGGNGGGS